MRLLFAALILLVPAVEVQAEDSWSFVVIPDLVNNDVAIDDPDWFGDGLDGTFDDGTYAALPFTLDAVAAESPDFVLVPGDLVMGRWSLDAFTDAEIQQKITTDPDNFAHLDGLSGVEARQAHVRHMAERFYPDWNQMWSDRGVGNVYTIPGDHEVGDNDWNQSYDADLIPVYREKYEQYLPAPAGATSPDGYNGRAFEFTHKNLSIVGVDVFETDANGDMDLGVSGEQLTFVEQSLAGSAAAHKLVMGHTPILPGARKRSSSGLELPGGANSGLWQAMASDDVDLYLAGEVHDISMQEKDGILQAVTGSQPSNVEEFNYMVVNVFDSKFELELKRLETTTDGPRDVAADPYQVDPYVDRQVKLTQTQHDNGFQSVGTMVIDKTTGDRQFIQKTGYFETRYTVLDSGPLAGGNALKSAVIGGTDLTYAIDTSGFDENTEIYTDRDYVWAAANEGDNLPEELLGADYLQTANDDKNNANLTVELDVAAASMLYVFFDDRIDNRPEWLTTQFSDTGDDLAPKKTDGTRGATWSIWEMTMEEAGTVNLGINSDGSEGTGIGHYGVAVQSIPEPGTFVLLLSALCCLALRRRDRPMSTERGSMG